MKKLTALILVLACIFALTACGGPASESPSPSPEQTVPVTPSLVPTSVPESAPPQNAILRMESVTADDIKYISSSFSNVTTSQLADAMRGAASHQIELAEPLTYTFYSLTAYLSGGPEGYSSNDEHFIFYASLEENLVQVFYRGFKGNRQELYLSDSNLYWLIRNNYHADVTIDKDSYAKYQSIIEARAQETVDSTKNLLDEPAFTGYEVTRFTHADAFTFEDAVYDVYSWNVAFITDDPTHVGWAGGTYLDAEGRVCAYEQNTYFVVKTTASGVEDYRFLFWSLYWGENEASQRENALNSILMAFSASTENYP